MMEFHKTAQAYIDGLCAKIKSRREREAFYDELSDHMEQKISFLMRKKGLSQDEAESEAVAAFGEAERIARRLNRVHTYTFENILKYACLAVTCVLGVLNLLHPYGLLGKAVIMEQDAISVVNVPEAAGVIGGADGPTAVYGTSGPSSLPLFLLFLGFLALTLFLFLRPIFKNKQKAPPAGRA